MGEDPVDRNRSDGVRKPTAFQNTFVRVGTLGIVMLVLLIPTWMVDGVIREREGRRREAVQEVAATWGGAQAVGGPVLTLPVDVRGKDAKGRPFVTHDHFWHLLPTALQVEGTVEPQLRRRGLFEVPLYRARLRLTGRFVPWTKAGAPDPSWVRWDAAQITLPLSETRGLIEPVVLSWDGGTVELGSESLEGTPTDKGLRARLESLTRAGWEKGFGFRVDASLQGSEDLRFLPLGEFTTVSLKSQWSSPGFVGSFLPFERAVAVDGFQATWRIPGLARGFPQQWRNRGVGTAEWAKAAFGVRLVVPVDHYNQSSRSVKYAGLFLLLTFTAFFLFELLLRARLHPMNYLLVGSAMCLFYLLLVALSERMPFGGAYWLATAATLGLIGAYAFALVRNRLATAGLVGFLGGLYGYLYVLLRLEDSSLLLGALALFVVLAVVMYLTRNLDWYNLSNGSPPAGRGDGAAPDLAIR
jgi:inner membrane protein